MRSGTDKTTDTEADQAEVVAFLLDPATYGIDTPVTQVTTHSAHVFLAGDMAFKIKRPVRYTYLDFSTLAARHAVIGYEMALNAPSAPMIYDRVVPITRETSGALALDGTGVPVEYALRMHRFAREDELICVAKAGGLTNDLADRLGRVVAALHGRAEQRAEDGATLIGEIVDELHKELRGMEPLLAHDRQAEFFDLAGASLTRIAPMLTRRTRAGQVRRCHGDLHLKNLVLIDGEPVAFDALEFDERLGTCDVLYDLAFLVMDLLHRGLTRQANVLLNSYLTKARDFEGLATLPLFLGIRAAIRSMTAVQSLATAPEPEAMTREARTLLELAIDCLDPLPPRLVAIGGLSGSGKTTIAARVAPMVWPVPGAVHLRSDLERKAMLGVDPLEHLPDSAYRPEVSAQVYDHLLQTAETVLRAGHGVIIDAAFLDQSEREAVEALAKRLEVPFDGLWLTADPATLERRVSARRADASDADVAVLRKQLARGVDAIGWIHIDATGGLEQVTELAEAILFTV